MQSRRDDKNYFPFYLRQLLNSYSVLAVEPFAVHKNTPSIIIDGYALQI